MLDYLEDEEDDDDSNQAEPPAYMSQPMMQTYADRLMSLIDDFYEESTNQPITPEALAFRDALITVYQRIVVVGEVDELNTRLRTLFPCAVYDVNPTSWDDLLEFRMSTIN